MTSTSASADQYECEIIFNIKGPNMDRKNTCEWMVPTRVGAVAITARMGELMADLTAVDVAESVRLEPDSASGYLSV